MSDVLGPEVEQHNNVLELNYDSDGVLAVEKGTEYSKDQGEFESPDSNKLITVEAGESVYIESGSKFGAYDIDEFAKELAQNSGWIASSSSKKTKIWGQNDSHTGSGNTAVFNPLKYDIGNPVEYVAMMKENSDTIALELADIGVEGGDISTVVDRITSSINDTYDRFVHSDQDTSEDTAIYKQERGSTDKVAEKRKLTEKDAKKYLDNVEKELSKNSENSDELGGEDTEELLEESKPPAAGQSEISDW